MKILARLATHVKQEEVVGMNAKVEKDGSYTFIYEGTLTSALTLVAAKEGPLSQKDKAEFE